jgi:hypothetical protein
MFSKVIRAANFPWTYAASVATRVQNGSQAERLHVADVAIVFRSGIELTHQA